MEDISFLFWTTHISKEGEPGGVKSQGIVYRAGSIADFLESRGEVIQTGERDLEKAGEVTTTYLLKRIGNGSVLARNLGARVRALVFFPSIRHAPSEREGKDELLIYDRSGECFVKVPDKYAIALMAGKGIRFDIQEAKNTHWSSGLIIDCRYGIEQAEDRYRILYTTREFEADKESVRSLARSFQAMRG